jgi:hypothetical protein
MLRRGELPPARRAALRAQLFCSMKVPRRYSSKARLSSSSVFTLIVAQDGPNRTLPGVSFGQIRF